MSPPDYKQGILKTLLALDDREGSSPAEIAEYMKRWPYVSTWCGINKWKWTQSHFQKALLATVKSGKLVVVQENNNNDCSLYKYRLSVKFMKKIAKQHETALGKRKKEFMKLQNEEAPSNRNECGKLFMDCLESCSKVPVTAGGDNQAALFAALSARLQKLPSQDRIFAIKMEDQHTSFYTPSINYNYNNKECSKEKIDVMKCMGAEDRRHLPGLFQKFFGGDEEDNNWALFAVFVTKMDVYYGRYIDEVLGYPEFENIFDFSTGQKVSKDDVLDPVYIDWESFHEGGSVIHQSCESIWGEGDTEEGEVIDCLEADQNGRYEDFFSDYDYDPDSSEPREKPRAQETHFAQNFVLAVDKKLLLRKNENRKK